MTILGKVSVEKMNFGQELIGDDGLTGERRGNLIEIAGPCGGSHVFNVKNALALRDWLMKVLSDETPVASAKSAPLVRQVLSAVPMVVDTDCGVFVFDEPRRRFLATTWEL